MGTKLKMKFELKMDFYGWNIFQKWEKRLIPIDLNEILSMKPIEFEISYSIESYDKKATEKWLNFNDAEKRIVSKL